MGHSGTYCAGIEIFKRTVSGEYIKSQVEIAFYNATTPLGAKNVLIFKNVPSDVARGIDAAIDVQVKAKAGNVLRCDSETDCDSANDNWNDPTTGDTDTLGLVVDF